MIFVQTLNISEHLQTLHVAYKQVKNINIKENNKTTLMYEIMKYK